MLILSSNLSFFSSDLYNKNPLDCLLKTSIDIFESCSFELSCALTEFFKENSIAWKEDHWTKKVQRALTIPPSSKGVAKKRRMEQNPALNHLCEKALKWIQYLPEIRKLEKQLGKFWFVLLECKYGHEEDDEDVDETETETEDEDENQEKEQMQKQMKKPLFLEKAERMIKIMIDIAVDLGNPNVSEEIQSFSYDIKKRPISRRSDGSRFYVEKGKNLSDAQLKLSPFAYLLAHPSPEELGISSQN
jgi:hypothetical protein